MKMENFTDIEIILAGVMNLCVKSDDEFGAQIVAEGVGFLTGLEETTENDEEARQLFEQGIEKLKAIAAHTKKNTKVVLIEDE